MKSLISLRYIITVFHIYTYTVNDNVKVILQMIIKETLKVQIDDDIRSNLIDLVKKLKLSQPSRIKSK